MTKSILIPAFLVLILAACPASGEGDGPAVVVELFTSEGCSSCPPADSLLHRLAGEAADEDAFILLAYHTDYWDRLGWEDPFVVEGSDLRHKAYTKRLSPTKLYTPQAVVNGAAETGGGDEEPLRELISEAREKPAPVTVRIVGARPEEDGWTIEYAASGEIEGALVFAAVTQSGLVSEVTAGENEGMRLVHDHVVRGFNQAEAAAEGTIAVAAPRIEPAQSHAVVLIQDRESLHVLGAARTALTGFLESEGAQEPGR